MKKIIALILTLVIALTFTSTCFAEEYYMYESTSGTAQTEVQAHVYSTYSIIIPATINLSENNICSITIGNCNLEDNYQVRVYCSNMSNESYITLYNTQDSSKSVYCDLTSADGTQPFTPGTPIATFTQEEVVSGNNVRNFSLRVRNDMNKAGDYTGIIEYQFDCVPM